MQSILVPLDFIPVIIVTKYTDIHYKGLVL